MTRRIVLTGPECSGKTTLAATLAEQFGAPWLPEASRAYAVEKARDGHTLTQADVEPIARRAVAAEDAALADAPPMLVLDTDLLSTVTYARHYYGTSSAWLEDEAHTRQAALYLLCAPDLPWTPDGIRDRPTNREELFTAFEGVIAEFGARVVVVRGTGPRRTDAAVRAVTPLVDGAVR